METETIASRGIVDLMLKEAFPGGGLCPPGASSQPPEGLPSLWGWEC